ncbi:MAG: 6-phosphofructokinase [Aigarchaeota archaeon]|nr:6-phosphofructokinase [Aigarchaeota archaeon]MCX8192251.1 6-phosphofructokinase [Nitrososphaeria archaeon]MDW7986141.1 ATP-dependent 6-phosphofructokinase [Nitrososphaerota archaeon]
MKKIGIVTSGGDAPGMNAAIRALVRLSAWNNIQVIGFIRGWEGVINNRFTVLNPRSVSGILHLGGTILKTSRSLEFKTREGLEKAAVNLEKDGVDGLVVIGGEGSVRGAYELSKFTDVKIVVLPASIDNDVYGTDETIGFDTAVNTALDEINKIRDTAISHERTFIVEVMGRKRGFLAVEVGLTAGAEVILVPEVPYNEENVLDILKKNVDKGKSSSIIVIAEGVGKTSSLAEAIEKKVGVEVRVSILGYVQRGGNPTARSRHLASIFSEKAIELMLDGVGGRLVGLMNGRVSSISLEESISNEKPLNLELLKLAEKLAI